MKKIWKTIGYILLPFAILEYIFVIGLGLLFVFLAVSDFIKSPADYFLKPVNYIILVFIVAIGLYLSGKTSKNAGVDGSDDRDGGAD